MKQEATYPVVYRGSVKNIRVAKTPQKKTPGRYVFEFTDAYSVFDYGKMPDSLRGKGCAIALMSAYLFEEMAKPSSWNRLFRRSDIWPRVGGEAVKRALQRSSAARGLTKQGLETHYLGMLDSKGKCRSVDQITEPSSRMLVKAVPVVNPVPLAMDGGVLWDYNKLHSGLPLFLVPLENVFRFGVPKGSSLLGRLKKYPEYGAQIGLERVPKEGEWLSQPVLEFFSKLEPMDRHLSLETALNFSGLEGKDFLKLKDLSLLVAIFIFDLFRRKGMDVWDGKFEFVKANDELLLADSITPDELRITIQGTQLSKEPLRQYYKKNDLDFLAALRAVKDKGPTTQALGTGVKKQLGRRPMKLDRDFRVVMEQMYQALAYRITGADIFSGSMDLDSVVDRLRAY